MYLLIYEELDGLLLNKLLRFLHANIIITLYKVGAGIFSD